jgi:diguanylate cyclase (GGDEF)-like protein
MRILLAEDDPVSRKLVESFLAKWGHEVFFAADGNEAWALLQEPDGPRLAILDWMMPGMDGVHICREIRKQTSRPYVYLMLLTSKSEKQELLAGLEAGADDYLVKPFDPEELRYRLRAGKRILDLQQDLLSMRDAMQHPESYDPLTGLANRESILGLLRQKLAQERGFRPLGVILANVDCFRQAVHAYGLPAGDMVLREVARRLRSVVDSRGVIGRTRTGEFLIVMSGCEPAQLMRQAEELRTAVSASPIDLLGATINVSISAGVATAAEASDVSALMIAADAAVRRAKAKGRNCIEPAFLADPGALRGITGPNPRLHPTS